MTESLALWVWPPLNDLQIEYKSAIFRFNLSINLMHAMTAPRISLDQWRSLLAIVDAGGYAQAAAALHKSQSAVSYAVQKLERLLDIKVFELQGRKAQLTPAGQVLVQRARALVEEATTLEQAAAVLAQGWEPELRIAAEIIFPTWLLLECLGEFAQERPETRIELIESVLGGTDEALTGHRVDLAIGSQVPPGFAGDLLMQVRFVAAAHPDHALHRLGRPVTLQDLRKHRHLVIRDSGMQRVRSGGGWIGSGQRWTVSNKATSIRAACMGLGFAWYPVEAIREELARGELQPLPLREGRERQASLYLIFADRDYAGPGARKLAQIIRARVQAQCALAHQAAT